MIKFDWDKITSELENEIDKLETLQFKTAKKGPPAKVNEIYLQTKRRRHTLEIIKRNRNNGEALEDFLIVMCCRCAQRRKGVKNANTKISM